MPLRLGDAWTPREPVGDWLLPGEPSFAGSSAFDLLLRDLRRYVREEVPGRSFLVAGHRGAGKTATVTQAVRKLRNDILTESADPGKLPTGRRGRLQRPMIVKLVGQALLAPPPRQREVEAQQAGQPATPSGGAAAKGSGGADAPAGKVAAAQAQAPDKAEPPEPPDPAASALVHLTIALYRALAAEISEGFFVHARNGGNGPIDERLELAAQLELELDGTPEPAALRFYWEKLRRLADGVLWPPDTDKVISAQAPRAVAGQGGPAGAASQAPAAARDQGLHEVVAVATAAQAFQVCSGAVTYAVSRQDSDIATSKRESSLDVKDLVNRLGAIGAGTVAGGIVGTSQSSAVQGVGIGLLVWLLGNATLAWTTSRERKKGRTLDYKFLQDRSIQTLDRDLPLVIERIRQAGLAPVFVIDELDKLERPREQIAQIIQRLKHLVTDYGFFCFLGGRDYYDQIERKIADEPYPTEHTYFGERVLVLNRAGDLFDYLIGRIVPDPGNSAHELLRAVFALVVMYRSKLNFIDIEREIARLAGQDALLRCTDEELQAPGRYRLAATIQIAINLILDSDEARERFDGDPAFYQLAIDALYVIPRSLEKDSDAPIDLGEAALRTALLGRMAEPAEGAGDPPAISRPDLRELDAMAMRLAAYLCDFQSLRSALEDEAKRGTAQAADRLQRLAQIVLTEKRGLLVREGGAQAQSFRFALDELARPVPSAAAPPARGPAEPTPRPVKDRKGKGRKAPPRAAAAETAAPPAAPPPDPQLLDADALFAAIAGLIAEAKLSVDDLVSSRLLPATVGNRLLDSGRADARVALEDRARTDAVERAVNARLAFAKAFGERGGDVAQALVLLARAEKRAEEAGIRESRPVLLGRISRYFDALGDMRVPEPLRRSELWIAMSAMPDTIVAFTAALQEKLPPLLADDLWQAPDLPKLWGAWREEVGRFLSEREHTSRGSGRVSLDDAMLAAQRRPPGGLFRFRLGEMDQLDWSRAALAALPRAGRDGSPPEAPFWLLFAALAALGFDGRALQRLTRKPPPGITTPADDDLAFITSIIARAPSAQPAVLNVVAEQPGIAPTLDITPGQPVLSIGKSDIDHYLPGLEWLVDNEMFAGGAYELDEDHPPVV